MIERRLLAADPLVRQRFEERDDVIDLPCIEAERIDVRRQVTEVLDREIAAAVIELDDLLSASPGRRCGRTVRSASTLRRFGTLNAPSRAVGMV